MEPDADVDMQAVPAASPEPAAAMKSPGAPAPKPAGKPKATKKRKRKAPKDSRKPKGRMSGYMYFTQATRAGLAEKHPGTSLGQLGKMMGAMWRELSDEDKAPFLAKAAEDKERYDKEMAAYKELCKTAPPPTFESEAKAKGKGKKAKDSRAPKGRTSSYMYFSKAKRGEIVAADSSLSLGDVAKKVSALWKALTDEEKAPYIKLAEADKARYQEESAAFKKLLAEEAAAAPATPAAAAEESKSSGKKKKAKKAKKAASTPEGDDAESDVEGDDVAAMKGKKKKKKKRAIKQVAGQRSLMGFFAKSCAASSPLAALPMPRVTRDLVPDTTAAPVDEGADEAPAAPAAAFEAASGDVDADGDVDMGSADAAAEPATAAASPAKPVTAAPSPAKVKAASKAAAEVRSKGAEDRPAPPKKDIDADMARSKTQEADDEPRSKTQEVAAVPTVEDDSDDSDDEAPTMKRPRKRRRAIADSDSDSDDGDDIAIPADAAPAAPATTPTAVAPASPGASAGAGSGAGAGAGAGASAPVAAAAAAAAEVEADGDVDMGADKADSSDDDDEDSDGDAAETKKEEAPAAKKPVSSFFGAAAGSSSKGKAKGKAKAATDAVDPAKRALVECFSAIEDTTKRLIIQDVLCNFLRTVIATTPGDLLACVNLCANRLAPAFAGIELGIGDGLMIKAVSQSSCRNARDVRADVHKLGDLGMVAEKSKSSQTKLWGFTQKALTVPQVFKNFLAIAKMSGSKSQDRKLAKIKQMMSSCEKKEARYLVRALQGKLRIGLAERTVLVALSHAVVLTPPAATEPIMDLRTTKTADEVTKALEKAEAAVKQAHSEMPSYDEIIPALLRGGVEEMVKSCTLRPGVPVSPMLAKPTRGVSEVLDRFSGIRFVCEWKYDGERGQIHCLPDGTVKIFSRNSEDTTDKFPDLIEMIPKACKDTTKTCVLDGEVVAYDREQGKLLPFQLLSTRSRKGATLENIQVQVVYVVFDILYLNGKSLLHETLETRKRLLSESFTEVKGKFEFAKALQCTELDQITGFLKESVAGNCEGLMVKTLVENSTYEPTRRSLNWLKLKSDYMDGLTDSLDLVPIAAYKGKGKRTGVFGAYLLACYNEDDEEFQAITKIGTGFSDEVLASHTKYFQEGGFIRDTRPFNVLTGDVQKPDVWFEPSVVWEVKAADLSISPVYKAAVGHVNPTKGIALRFPRFLRIRKDKDPEQCTNATQVAQMYRDQGLTVATKAPSLRRGGAASDEL